MASSIPESVSSSATEGTHALPTPTTQTTTTALTPREAVIRRLNVNIAGTVGMLGVRRGSLRASTLPTRAERSTQLAALANTVASPVVTPTPSPLSPTPRPSLSQHQGTVLSSSATRPQGVQQTATIASQTPPLRQSTVTPSATPPIPVQLSQANVLAQSGVALQNIPIQAPTPTPSPIWQLRNRIAGLERTLQNQGISENLRRTMTQEMQRLKSLLPPPPHPDRTFARPQTTFPVADRLYEPSETTRAEFFRDTNRCVYTIGNTNFAPTTMRQVENNQEQYDRAIRNLISPLAPQRALISPGEQTLINDIQSIAYQQLFQMHNNLFGSMAGTYMAQTHNSLQRPEFPTDQVSTANANHLIALTDALDVPGNLIRRNERGEGTFTPSVEFSIRREGDIIKIVGIKPFVIIRPSEGGMPIGFDAFRVEVNINIAGFELNNQNPQSLTAPENRSRVTGSFQQLGFRTTWADVHF